PWRAPLKPGCSPSLGVQSTCDTAARPCLAPGGLMRSTRPMIGPTSSSHGSPDLPAFTADPAALLRVPRATYRLQLGPDLTFDDAAALVPYLAALGISDCYISPFLEASSTRSHGYDVSDHGRVRAELAGETAFGRFAAALRRHSLGLLFDVVPHPIVILGSRRGSWFG